MGKLTFYFDRNIGKRLPEALCHLRTPFDVTWHNQQRFSHNMPDDEWMSIVGKKGWIVISQDYKFHSIEVENLAVRQHSLKCFYLPDSGAKVWTTFCAFSRAHEKMMNLCVSEAGPFIFSLKTSGRLIRVDL